jgi:hypothetical protein
VTTRRQTIMRQRTEMNRDINNLTE